MTFIIHRNFLKGCFIADSLVAQIKMKDVQISKLLNVIRQQKLGLNSDIL